MDAPESVRVLVRGWLNSNQVLLLGEPNVLIDTGYATHAEATLRLLADHLGSRRLDRILHTHCHCDHVGGDAALVRRYACAVIVPEGEAERGEVWKPRASWTSYVDQETDSFQVAGTMAAGSRFEVDAQIWEAVAAPGHDENALLFWSAQTGILISGDALWEDGFGTVYPRIGTNPEIDAARRTFDRIESLEPRWIIPGHGRPFRDVDGALARARGRLDAYEKRPERHARHVVKTLLMFTLLARGRLRRADLASYLESVGCSREMNETFIHLPFDTLARGLVADLAAAGVVSGDDEWISPLIPA